jgi:hypothetical protein
MLGFIGTYSYWQYFFYQLIAEWTSFQLAKLADLTCQWVQQTDISLMHKSLAFINKNIMSLEFAAEFNRLGGYSCISIGIQNVIRLPSSIELEIVLYRFLNSITSDLSFYKSFEQKEGIRDILRWCCYTNEYSVLIALLDIILLFFYQRQDAALFYFSKHYGVRSILSLLVSKNTEVLLKCLEILQWIMQKHPEEINENLGLHSSSNRSQILNMWHRVKKAANMDIPQDLKEIVVKIEMIVKELIKQMDEYSVSKRFQKKGILKKRLIC